MELILVTPNTMINPDKIVKIEQQYIKKEPRLVVTLEGGSTVVVESNVEQVLADLVRSGVALNRQFWAG